MAHQRRYQYLITYNNEGNNDNEGAVQGGFVVVVCLFGFFVFVFWWGFFCLFCFVCLGFFYNLPIAPQTVSNTDAPVARALSRANRVQHITLNMSLLRGRNGQLSYLV